MYRESKGHGIKEHIDDYCVMDLETTEIFIRSAKIIEIAAIKVRNNQIVDEFSTLVNPKCHIPSESTAINHITNEMVEEAPTIDEVIDSLIEFVKDDVIVGYNNAGFDMLLIYDLVERLRGVPFYNNYIDIMHCARRCIKGIENYKLETLSKYYSLDTVGEHRALKDCYLTKAVYDNLYNEYGDNAFDSKESASKGFSIRYSVETKALQELQSLLEAIIEDGKVTIEEFSFLQSWMTRHRELQGNYPFDRVFNALDKVLEDGKVDPCELEELQILFSDFVDPVKSRGCHTEIKSIKGKHIVITGEFDYGSRNEVLLLIERAGGIIDKSVRVITNYVVVGVKGSDSWKTGKYGGKIQKAMELKDKGMDIEIIEENLFIPVLQCIIKNHNK